MADLKTLKVCLSKDLPLIEDRDSNIIYFVYDKLTVFLGKNLYSNPYAIVETIPQEPMSGILYFCLDDGIVKASIEYEIKDIAEIENNEQLEMLKNTGSTFFVNSQKRYLDLNRRIITLPFQNGTYELTVSLANDLIIDKNTIITFNPETNMFEITGSNYDHGNLFLKDYIGKDTNTIDNEIEECRISSNVKVSNAYDNIIKILSDGLYVNIEDRVKREEFIQLEEYLKNYKLYLENYMKDIINNLEEFTGEIISGETISKRILSSLENVYPEIEYALENYSKMTSQFDGIEKRVKDYADKRFDEAYSELNNIVTEASNNAWDDFESEIPQDE